MNTYTTYHYDMNQYNSEEEALAAKAEREAKYGTDLKGERYEIVAKVNAYANYHMYTDVKPYEIVRVISDKTIEVRPMTAVRKEESKPNIVVGGFSGHCTNNYSIEYDITPNLEAGTMRIRKKKNGQWGNGNMRFILSTTPSNFYDYNF